jgi:hypothetical protein
MRAPHHHLALLATLRSGDVVQQPCASEATSRLQHRLRLHGN